MEIRLENVSYTYNTQQNNTDKNALNHISLNINQGEYIAVIGKTGSGKSTLLHILNGLIKPSEGTCYMDGKNIHEKGFPIQKMRQKVALCFQYPEYQLFEETVLKDICFGPENLGLSKKEAEEKAREAMKLTGLTADMENLFPFSLSGGQKRRVALAGILAMEPDCLVLDEPVAGLDEPGRKQLFDILEKMNQRGVTVILVSHNMEDVAAYARRVLVMHEGELLMDNTPENVFSDEKIMQKTGLKRPVAVQFFYNLTGDGELPDQGTMTSPKIPLTLDALADWILERNRSTGGEK